MLTNNIIRFITGLLSILFIPIIPITTFLIGLLVSISFGLLLIPISIIWSIVFYFPLLGLSFVYENFNILRPFAAIIGIPFAVLGEVFVSLLPSMGENDSKMAKWLSTTTFPYTYSISVFTDSSKSKYLMKKDGHYELLLKILYKEREAKPIMKAYIDDNLLSK